MGKRTDESQEFCIFWEQIWRKHARHTDGRGLARDAFNKLVKHGAEPQDIIDGAKWFFQTMKEKDRDYVPLSATWLHRQSYEDLAEQYRAHEARKQERQRPQEPSPNVVNIDPAKRAEMAARARAAVAGARLQEAT